MSEQVLCTYVLPVCESTEYTARNLNVEVFDLMTEKTPIGKQNNYLNELYTLHSHKFGDSSRDTIKVAMMSDLHIDYDY